MSSQHSRQCTELLGNVQISSNLKEVLSESFKISVEETVESCSRFSGDCTTTTVVHWVVAALGDAQQAAYGDQLARMFASLLGTFLAHTAGCFRSSVRLLRFCIARCRARCRRAWSPWPANRWQSLARLPVEQAAEVATDPRTWEAKRAATRARNFTRLAAALS